MTEDYLFGRLDGRALEHPRPFPRKQIISRRLISRSASLRAALPVQQRQSWQAYASCAAEECRRASNKLLHLKDLRLARCFFLSKYLRLGALGVSGAPGTRGDRDFDQMAEHGPTKTSLKPIETLLPAIEQFRWPVKRERKKRTQETARGSLARLASFARLTSLLRPGRSQRSRYPLELLVRKETNRMQSRDWSRKRQEQIEKTSSMPNRK